MCPRCPASGPACGCDSTATAGLSFNKISLDRLPLFLRGSGNLAVALYEQLLANCVAVVVRPAESPVPWQVMIDPAEIRRVGFRDDEAMLPDGPRSFQGYRLLQEYFALPERFLFVELGGLAPAVQRCTGKELEVFLLFDRVSRALEHRVDASMFDLFCTPAINLFPRRADRIHLGNHQYEFHVVPDRTRPQDYEAYQVTEVTGYGDRDEEQVFLPFYASFDRPSARDMVGRSGDDLACYTVRRTHRVLSDRQRATGTRTSYVGSELYLSLVDTQEAPYRHDLRQVGVGLLCTNRDLPLLMPVGVGETDFAAEVSLPVRSYPLPGGADSAPPLAVVRLGRCRLAAAEPPVAELRLAVGRSPAGRRLGLAGDAVACTRTWPSRTSANRSMAYVRWRLVR